MLKYLIKFKIRCIKKISFIFSENFKYFYIFLIWCLIIKLNMFKNLIFLHLYYIYPTDKYHYYENYSLYYSFGKLEWLIKKNFLF